MPPKGKNNGRKGGGGQQQPKSEAAARNRLLRNRRRRNKKRVAQLAQDPTQLVRSKKLNSYAAGSKLGIISSSLAYAISLPGPTTAMRFPDENAESTDVKGFRFVNALTHPMAGNIAFGFTATDFALVFFGTPACMFMYWKDSVPSGSTYQLVLSTIDINGNDSFGQTQGLLSVIVANNASMNGTTAYDLSLPINIVGAVSNSVGFHGPWLSGGYYSGGSSTDYYVYMNSGDVIALTFTFGYGNVFAGWNGAGFVNVDFYSLPGRPSGTANRSDNAFGNSAGAGLLKFNLPTNNLGTAVVQYTPQVAGWYSFILKELVITTAPATGFVSSINVTGTLTAGVLAGWSIVCAPDFISPAMITSASGIPMLAENARVNGASILITNTTNMLNRGGSVNAARMFAMDTRPEDVTKMTLMATSNDTYTGDAANGVYTFVENTAWRSHRRRHATAAGPFMALGDDSKYHYIAITSSVPQTYTVTVNFILEYKTTLQAVSNNRVAAGVVTDLQRARGLINESPEWFFENPLHMSQIFSWVRSGAKALAHYGPGVVGAIGQASGNSSLQALASALMHLRL